MHIHDFSSFLSIVKIGGPTTTKCGCVQFISPRSLEQWIHYFFTSPRSLQLMNSLKIQWNHLAYMDTFCCSAFMAYLFYTFFNIYIIIFHCFFLFFLFYLFFFEIFYT
jgi:hypothetical protein